MQSIIINGSKAGIGLFYPTAAVLVILQVISNGLKAFMMIFLLNWSSNIKIKNIKFNNNISIKSLAKKYIDFPLLRAPEVFLSSFSQNLPVLLLTSLFGPASAGFYSIGRTVLSLPSSLIGNAVGDVFYPHITKAANKREDLNYIIRKATITLFGVGLIPFGTIILFGPILFKLVFGAEWGTAGEYARWIALFSFSIFINKPSVKSFPVLKAQGIHLIFTITILIVQSIALLVGFFVFKDDKVAVAFFGTSGMILNILLIFVTLKMANKFNENNYR